MISAFSSQHSAWKLLLVLFCLSGTVLSAQDAPANPFEALGIDVHGFIDARAGFRTVDDPNEKDHSLGELRIQGDISRQGDWLTWQVRADLLFDDVPDDTRLDIAEGRGTIDLRDANILFSPVGFMDVKLGRQILTWGTGDLLFIHDLFPKDWRSFFSGRDQEYLKAPSDALFVSLFPDIANIDVAYTPRFNSDRYIDGERLSYWNPMRSARSGRRDAMPVSKPDDWGDDDEWAIRISRNVSGYELALYGYQGFWKTPQGFDPVTTNATFPCLSVYGASLRGALGPGIMNAELGFYVSEDDDRGHDPFVPNSEIRALIGYEREVARNTTVGLQYYLEHMQDYHDYEASLAPGANARDEDRQVLTLRVTRQAFNQDLTLSSFLYYSPTDEDAYWRPNLRYKITDQWLVSAGANLFVGEEDHTFFGQFEKNNNVYAATRYSF